MIVYLGMPRCASSWLYDQLKHIEFANTIKETHYLYTNPENVTEYCKSKILDFSTNNWSMDSAVATNIDPYVTNYVLVFRDPIELAISYKTLFNIQQSLDDFVSTMITNKLLCYGDILERWYSLVDPGKLLVFKYDQIAEDNTLFIRALTTKLNVPMPTTISQIKTNTSKNKIVEYVSDKNLEILHNQTIKANTIINNLLNI